jgi:integrase
MEWAKANAIDFRPFAFHNLGHLHAVNWLKDGRSIYVLQRRLGHASMQDDGALLRIPDARGRPDREGTERAQK